MRHVSNLLFLCATGVSLGQVFGPAPYDALEVSLAPAALSYCHIVHFPQGWHITHHDRHGEPLSFGSDSSDYEFRVAGVLSTKFLVAAFTDIVGTKYYTNNRYEVDLSDSTAPGNGVELKAWNDAAVVPLIRKSGFPPGFVVPNESHLEFHGHQFEKSGETWGQPSGAASRLSPDQMWLVLQSSSRGKRPGTATVFFDFFNADSGTKLFTLEGTFLSQIQDEADGALAQAGWVTERYFIVPLGRKIDHCLVCDFGRSRENGANK